MRAIEFDATGEPSALQLVNAPSDGVSSYLFEKNGEEKPLGFPIRTVERSGRLPGQRCRKSARHAMSLTFPCVAAKHAVRPVASAS